MRRNRLTVHGNHTANVDAFPNLPLQSSANARLIEDADPRPQCLVLLQCVPVVVEPDEKMQMGVPGSLEFENPVIVLEAVTFHELEPTFQPAVEHERRHVTHLL